MAKRLSIPSKHLALKLVGSKDSLVLPRVQRVGLDVTANATDVDELGDALHAGTSIDTPDATLTFSAFDVGVKIFSILTGTDYRAYPGLGVDISNLGEFDAVLFVKDATLSDYVKSAHARRLQVRDFTFTYNVTGDSTEDYSAIGSEKRFFKNDVVVDKFTTGTAFTLSQTPIQLKNGNKLLSVIVNGVYTTEVSGVPAAGEYAVTGTALTTGDTSVTVLAVYHANPAGNNWADVRDVTMPASIKGKDVKIYIGVNNIERVQSVTINGNLKPEAIKEMGNRAVVGYQRQVPTVEGTLAVLDTDLELVAQLTTGDKASADTEFSVVGAAGCLTVSGMPLYIKLVDPCDVVAPYDVLKTIYIPTITIIGDSYASTVNGNATQNFNFRSATGACIVFSGSYSG